MIDLSKSEIFEEMSRQVRDVILADDNRRATVFVRNMEYALASDENAKVLNDPELLEKYNYLSDQMKFIGLPSFFEKEILELYQKRLLVALTLEDYNLNKKTRDMLRAIPSFPERDNMRRKLRQALIENNEVIGDVNIHTENNEKEGKPTIGNWIRKYNIKVGSSPADKIKQSEFFVNDKDIRVLDKAYQEILRKLFYLYEYLKLSSQTPEGLEDYVVFKIDDQLKVLKHGEFEDVKLPFKQEKIIDEILMKFKEGPVAQTEELHKEIISAYQGGDANKGILEEYGIMKKSIAGDAKKMREEFFKSMQAKNAHKSIACVILMAENDELRNVLVQDEKLKKFLSVIWEQKYGKVFADEFQKTPSAPKFLIKFLQYIMQERLGLNTGEAARIGAKVGNIYKKKGLQEYGSLAYFDMEHKEFRWMEE